MFRLIAASAFALFAGAAFAQDDAATTEEGAAAAPGDDSSAMAQMVRADDVAGAEIFTLAENYNENFWDSGEPFGPVLADLESIGEAESVILDRSGQVVGVTVDVGGFLGIGDKDVLLPLADIRLVASTEDEDELMIVTRLSRDELEEQDEVEGVFGEDD